MKNIKLRIVYLILGSALLLFALFMLAVNLIIPAHFVREAKKALISEAEYQNRTIPYTDDEAFFDDEWNDAEEHFLTPSIVFLELDNANQSSGWNRDAYRLEKKLLEYCAGRDITLDQCYTFKTDRHHLIFMSAQEDYGDGEEPYSYTAATTSTFRYELIDALAESQDYIILLMKKRYAQPLDKRTLTGGTVEEFKRFLEEKTGKTFRRVK